MEYQLTSDLPDDEGRALLDRLGQLYYAIQFSESGKKVRRGSSEERCAITDLRKAILDAADRFSQHEVFSAWLCKNHCYHIDAYDPLRVIREFRQKLDILQRRVEDQEERIKWTEKYLLEIALQLPKTQNEAA